VFEEAGAEEEVRAGAKLFKLVGLGVEGGREGRGGGGEGGRGEGG